MTTFARPSSSWVSLTKVGLTLAFLFSQMPVQAAPIEPVPPDLNAADRVIVKTDRVKIPHKHRETKRGPSKPEKYDTKPQQLIRNLR